MNYVGYILTFRRSGYTSLIILVTEQDHLIIRDSIVLFIVDIQLGFTNFYLVS